MASRHTAYPVMSEPPSAVGATHVTEIERSPPVDRRPVGAPGATTNVRAADASAATDASAENSEEAVTDTA